MTCVKQLAELAGRVRHRAAEPDTHQPLPCTADLIPERPRCPRPRRLERLRLAEGGGPGGR